MKKLLLSFPLVALLAASGCIKMSSDSAIGNDASATVKMSFGYKKETLETLKTMIEAQLGMIDEEDAGGLGEKLTESLAAVEGAFEDKRIAEEWKKLGVEVTKSSTVEKDGWKLVEVEGTIKDLAAYNAKAKEARKAVRESLEASADDPDPSAALSSFAKTAIPQLPRFYKTDKPDIAKVVLDPTIRDVLDRPNANRGMPDLDELDDDQREMIEGQLDQFRVMFSIDELKIELKTKLPGKVLSVQGLKQEGEDTVIFTFGGSSIGLDGVKTAFGLKNLSSATLQFNPETFKIPLEDEPKAAESQPATKPAKKIEKNEEEKKNKEEGDEKEK